MSEAERKLSVDFKAMSCSFGKCKEELESLKQENVKLKEKIFFLENLFSAQLDMVEKIKNLEEQLKAANSVIDFYGKITNWSIDSSDCQFVHKRQIMYGDLEEINETTKHSGKRAREYKKKWGEL